MTESITILTVDDTETNIDIILGILEDYDVIPALSGQSALDIAFNEKIDLILLDIMMPNMDGFEVCRQLKNNPKTKHIPIIFLTAKNDDKSIQKAYDEGGIDYIIKPFRPIELTTRVNNQINIKKHEIESIKHNKLISLTELINNIAHQWRQPLSSISTSASGIQLHDELGMLTPELLNQCTNQILTECEYLSSIIEGFKDLVEDSRETSLFDIKELFSQNKNMIFGGLCNCGIEPIMNIEENIKINGSQIQLLQALMHIITNAQDVLCALESEEKLIFIDIKLQNNNIVIEILDNAGGLDENIISQIFEPYFTTKHQSQGKGLGLYTVHKIITDYFNGHVTASNMAYKHNDKDQFGAKMKITIPHTKD